MSNKKINERFQYFSIVLNVRKGESVNWKFTKRKIGMEKRAEE